MLYDIFIYPIEYLLKFIFETSYAYTDSYIVATVLLSIIVSIMLLPFYYWAEKLQNKERETLNKLQPTIDEFKSVYSGSKLHSVISTLYKQNNYHPIYSLRSVLGLLIQLPFFIAAYHFLSTYQPIVGVESWLFKDLGAPDGWLHIGDMSINIMPFIMTGVNLISGFIFTQGMTKSEKIQTWVLALVFLVLLYISPALLVLYWTMNNIFSLIKNFIEKKFNVGQFFVEKMEVFQKYINTKYFVFILLLIVVGIGSYYRIIGQITTIKYVFVISLALGSVLILFDKINVLTKVSSSEKDKLIQKTLFIVSFLFFIIPTVTIVASSPDEFSDFWKIFGILFFLFLLVFSLFRLITIHMNNRVKNVSLFIFSFLALFFVLNYFVFTGNYGIMDFFIFHRVDGLDSTFTTRLVDLSTIVLLLIIVIISLKKLSFQILNKIFLLISFILVIYITPSFFKLLGTNNSYSLSKSTSSEITDTLKPQLHFSQNGKNVLVLFLDRFIGGYLPDIFKDLPYLKEELSGFVWYPNTLSPGIGTSVGLPPIYGGYPFSNMEDMYKNNYDWNAAWKDSQSKLMQDRFSNSMNFILNKFASKGFNCFINDPCFIWKRNMKKVSQGKYRYAYLINAPQYVNHYYGDINKKLNNAVLTPIEMVNYYLLPFSTFKVSSLSERKKIYNQGKWNKPAMKAPDTGWIKKYIQNLAFMKALPDISLVDNTIKGSFNFITSELTHDVYAARNNGEVQSLVPQTNDNKSSVHKKLYEDNSIDKKDIERFHDGLSVTHFYADKEALVRASKLFEWLKNKGIYDNTKIIIVSDHGRGGVYNPMFKKQRSKYGTWYGAYHPILIVKDFNAKGNVKTDNTFMTVADVPSIALSTIDDDIVNINSYDKSKGFQLYRADKKTLTVFDNIFEPKNWVLDSSVK